MNRLKNLAFALVVTLITLGSYTYVFTQYIWPSKPATVKPVTKPVVQPQSTLIQL